MLTVRRAPRSRVGVSAALVGLESAAAFSLAHVAAGGAVPGPLWLGVFAALVYGGSLLVLRGQASIRLTLPVLMAAQVLGHAWLVALEPVGHHGGHAGSEGLLGLTPTMVLTHAAAGLVTGVMWAWRRRVVEVLLSWSEIAAVPVAHRAGTRRHRAPAVRRSSWVLVTAPLRGPPVAVRTVITAPA